MPNVAWCNATVAIALFFVFIYLFLFCPFCPCLTWIFFGFGFPPFFHSQAHSHHCFLQAWCQEFSVLECNPSWSKGHVDSNANVPFLYAISALLKTIGRMWTNHFFNNSAFVCALLFLFTNNGDYGDNTLACLISDCLSFCSFFSWSAFMYIPHVPLSRCHSGQCVNSTSKFNGRDELGHFILGLETSKNCTI